MNAKARQLSLENKWLATTQGLSPSDECLVLRKSLLISVDSRLFAVQLPD
jgi:hypothetical protein